MAIGRNIDGHWRVATSSTIYEAEEEDNSNNMCVITHTGDISLGKSFQ